MNPTYLLFGYRILAVDEDYAARLLEVCRRRGYAYDGFCNLPDGGISLRFRMPVARAVMRDCCDYGIPVCVLREGGLPVLLRALSHRMGLVVGFAVGVALLVASSQVVWDIRISGNETVSGRAIEEDLAACGFTVGTSLNGFRADVTENRVLLLDDRLAWISINRRGTVAYVEVREAVHTPADRDDDSPADIVAAEGGIIQRIELDQGNVRVMAGDVVGKGDVLVSGLYDSDRLGIRAIRASARVYARTVRDFSVTIPLTYEQKVYHTGDGEATDGFYREKSVNFFGKIIKFSKKTGNMGGSCDTIEGEKSLGLISEVGFPISVKTVWYLPYTVTTATRTYAEAEELAYYELSRLIAAIPGGAELIGKTVTVRLAEDAVHLECRVTCIEDIGTVRPIEIHITD